MKKLLILPFLLFSIVVSATNYYVKNGGNDLNTGLSDDQAWANHPWMSTWSGSINLQPGDIVYLKRGDTWSISNPSVMYMIVTESGTAGNYITTTAYGTGPKPKIKISTNSNYDVIYGVGQSYIILDNLDISHWNVSRDEASHKTGIHIGSDGSISHDWIIRNCEIHDCPAYGIVGGSDCYNITIGDTQAQSIATANNYSNHIYNCGYAGIMLSGCNPATRNSSFYIYYNYIHDINPGGGDSQNTYGISFSSGQSSTDATNFCYARFNYIANIPSWTGIDLHNGRNMHLQDNHIYNCKMGFGCQSVDKEGTWNKILSDLYIEGNIIENPTDHIYSSFFFTSITGSSDSQARNIIVRNNKFLYTSRPDDESNTYGLSISNSYGVIVEGNSFYNGPKGSCQGAILFSELVNDVTVSRNFIKNWYYSIFIHPHAIADNILINNNIINSQGVSISCEGNESFSGNLSILNNTIVASPIESYSQPLRLNLSNLPSGSSIKVKNNILGFTSPYDYIYILAPKIISGDFEVDNNLYWNSTKADSFNSKTISAWNSDGYDKASIITDPQFTNYGGTYSEDTDFGLKSNSPAINKGAIAGITTDYAGNPISGLPDIGALEFQNAEAPAPVLVNSVIENSAPSKIDLTFNLTLANIVPPTSAFSVKVNSNTRSVSSIQVSGTKVSLTLSGAIVYGDVVTISYTKPSTNPLQTVEGGQAASFSARSVTNKVAAPAPAAPLYASSSVENAAPSKLEIIYNLPLANILPATSAFTVTVNSNLRPVSSVSISGTKVSLILSSAVAYGDVVTVAYTKPTTNPLQTTDGGQAASFSAQSVTNKVAAPSPIPVAPVYVSSSVENATPSKLDIIFSLSLANIMPASTAFIVTVNSTTRSVSSVIISGTKVTLTLSAAIAYGDIITVAYNKPSTNPLQTPEGGKADSFTSKTVTNKIAAPPPTLTVPAYVSSSVENASPTKIDIYFNISLASIIPSSSAFTVLVNSSSRAVSSVAVSGTKVTLTLSSAVASGNVITVAYTKPASNPLQTSAGGQVASFTAQPVSNKVAAVNNNPVLVVNSPKIVYSGFVNELNATGSYDKDKDNLSFTWTVPTNVPVSSTTGPIIKFLGPSVSTPASIEFTVKISDGKSTVSKTVPVEILPYKPELEAAEIVDVEASSYYSQNYPYNIIDGNIGTMWSANGSDQWLLIELKESFNVQHVKLAFQSGQKSESYFDILGSTDKVTWEPILVKSASCGFSGDLQVFDFPPAKAEKEYKYVKVIGQGNSADAWNYISELKIYGFRYHNPSSFENLPVKLYPNPAYELINIRIDEPNLSFDFMKIIDLNGKILYQEILNNNLREFQFPLNLSKGMYLIQMGSGSYTLFTSKFIVSPR